MSILIKNIQGHRQAAYITKVDAESAVAAGAAAVCPGYPDIYEEVTDGERTQGYMTRSMVAVTPATKPANKPGPKPAAKPAAVVADSEGGEV